MHLAVSFHGALIVFWSVVFFLWLIGSPLYAQTRKYERKSITSLGTVLVKPGLSVDLGIVQNRLKAYLELPRFDFNVISENTVKEFRQKANQTDLSPESIGSALKQTVVPKILRLLKPLPPCVLRAISKKKTLPVLPSIR
ncbi:MAG: hypothetical protein CMR00_13035 [[Chlorobium] sp. 445]|nr:MAG: hypothetical protein CMR00_13035 [[Chlorobium] sp. 445]